MGHSTVSGNVADPMIVAPTPSIVNKVISNSSIKSFIFSDNNRCTMPKIPISLTGACQNDDMPELEAQLQLFDMAELVWSLCEILFIDTQPGTTCFVLKLFLLQDCKIIV